MNLCMVGQCQGGNAVLWFELFNNDLHKYKDIEEFTYICRNENELTANFKVEELYGKKKKSGHRYVQKLKKVFHSKVTTRIYFSLVLPKKNFDVIHIQGNYSPAFNLRIIGNTSAKIVLQIMGSDFYQNYVNKRSGVAEREKFVEVLNKVDQIVCSRESSKQDLLELFPFIENKLSVIRLGTSDKWLNLEISKSNQIADRKRPKVFLSTRGLYNYNNVDVLVEAFCKTYQHRKDEAVLNIINGYGNDEVTIKKVRKLVDEYDCQDIVRLIINKWVSEEELMEYYQQADYNFCIGTTDQLSISITYGLLTGTTNVLSPLETYFELRDSGYRSLEILKEVTVKELTNFFENLPTPNYSLVLADREQAAKEHIATENFKKFVNVYKQTQLKSNQ